MAANQDEVNNLNKLIDEIMSENVEAVEEVQSETQPEEEGNVEKGNQPEKEIAMESNMLRKIDGFKHIYKELFKEFERQMKERDQQLEDNDEYRRKTWLESMDLINQNLSKLLECISEVEGTVN